MSIIDVRSVAVTAAIRELVKQAGLEIDGPSYEAAAQSRADEFEIRVRMRVIRGVACLDSRMASYGARQFVEGVAREIDGVAAKMRGQMFRDLLDLKGAIDLVGDDDGTNGTEYERAERMSVRLMEESERLMRRARELRGEAA